MGGPYSFSISLQPRYGPTGVPMPHGYHQYPHNNQKLPFLATLDLPDMSHLTNDPIQHAPFWPSIPKFDRKPREYPNNHAMNFQRTLTGATSKWYIELPRNSFLDFNSLAMNFLTCP
jgi:hypothetical protein